MNVFYDHSPTMRLPPMISLFADPAYRDIAEALIEDPQYLLWLARVQSGAFKRHASHDMQPSAWRDLFLIMREQFSPPSGSGPAFLAWTSDANNSAAKNDLRVPELARFTPPVRLIWGIGDPYLNAGVAQDLCAHFPNATLVPLRTGHWPQIDMPEQVASALLAP
jgi:pimeloyl-ACP methyl ester carboxylesterase